MVFRSYLSLVYDFHKRNKDVAKYENKTVFKSCSGVSSEANLM